jgi:DNA-binding LytR/AlgR family response regulator
MNKTKVLIVEDEMVVAGNMYDILKKMGYKVLEPVINYTEGILSIETNKPDIAIIDIKLAGRKTGIDLAEKIRERYNIPFIFLTSNANSDLFNQAKEALPYAYLLKPFTKQGLYTSIEIALNNFNKSIESSNHEQVIINKAFFIKKNKVFFKLVFDDILYIKSSHVYIEIFMKNREKHMIRGSLNRVTGKLSNNFIQTHRAFIVNLDYLTEINNTFLKVNDKIVPVGKKYYQRILKIIDVV